MYWHAVTKVSQEFCNILVHASLQHIYHMTETVQSVEGTIVVVNTMTCSALLHFSCDFKATQINMQCNLIWEFMFYEFKLGHFCNAHMCIKRIIDRQNNQSISFSFNWNNALIVNKTYKRLLLTIRTLPAKLLLKVLLKSVRLIVVNYLSFRLLSTLFILSRDPPLPATGNQCSVASVSLYSYMIAIMLWNQSEMFVVRKVKA